MMTDIDRRITKLEDKLQGKSPGCNPSVFIVIPENRPPGPFDHNSYTPAEGEIDKYLKHLKESGQCEGCKGSCGIDWDPDGFKNHTIVGEQVSSSPEPHVLVMYCASPEIPILTRQLMEKGREA